MSLDCCAGAGIEGIPGRSEAKTEFAAQGEWLITFARSARKELERLSAEIAERVLEKVEALSQNPRPAGTTKLRGQKNLWRLRVGDYRVVYAINDAVKAVDVSIVRHRREVYRACERTSGLR